MGTRLEGKVTDPGIGIIVSEKVRAALTAQWLCIVHVDHDSEGPNGDIEGDHFVLAQKLSNAQPLHYECIDPAPGNIVWLDAARCQGTTRWGKAVKVYKGVGALPLGIAVPEPKAA